MRCVTNTRIRLCGASTHSRGEAPRPHPSAGECLPPPLGGASGTPGPSASGCVPADSRRHDGCEQWRVGVRAGGTRLEWPDMGLPDRTRDGRHWNRIGECGGKGARTPFGKAPTAPFASLTGSPRANGPRPCGCEPAWSERLLQTQRYGLYDNHCDSAGVVAVRSAVVPCLPFLRSGGGPDWRLRRGMMGSGGSPHALPGHRHCGLGDGAANWCFQKPAELGLPVEGEIGGECSARQPAFDRG